MLTKDDYKKILTILNDEKTDMYFNLFSVESEVYLKRKQAIQ